LAGGIFPEDRINAAVEGLEARASIGRYIGFYYGRRPHSTLDGKTSDQAYFNPLTLVLVAA
jgi:putative transposase